MPDTSTTVQLDAPPVHDEAFLADVVAGLTAEPKHLPCKYFYDQRGSQLFDRICQLDEYYPCCCIKVGQWGSNRG